MNQFEDSDLPPLILYKGDDHSRQRDFSQFFIPKDIKDKETISTTLRKQQTIQITQKSPSLLRQNTQKNEQPKQQFSPTIIHQNSISQSLDTTPTRRSFRTKNQDEDKKISPPLQGEQKEKQHAEFQYTPFVAQKILNQVVDEKLKQYDSEKLIEAFLGNQSPNLTYAEVEDFSDAMIEKQIQKLDQDELIESQKIKGLRTEQKALPKNDIRIKYMEQEVILLGDKLLLMHKVKNLFKDKLTLRSQILGQKNLLNQLAQRIVTMDTEFTEQIHQLKTYNATLPTDRERLLELNQKKLEKQLDQEKKLRENLESAVAVNINAFQSLFLEAQEAKGHIIDQLKNIKEKKEDLDHKHKLYEEQQIQAVKLDTQHINKKTTSYGNQQDQRQSFAQMASISSSSSRHTNPQPTAGGLSKMIQRSVQQQENSFSKVQIGKDTLVLQGLNTTTDRQIMPQQIQNSEGKKQNLLGIIKENESSQANYTGEFKHYNHDNASKINSMVTNLKYQNN